MEFESLSISMRYYNVAKSCLILGNPKLLFTSYFISTTINPMLEMRQLCHSQADTLAWDHQARKKPSHY